MILSVPAEVESFLGNRIAEAAAARSGSAVALWTIADEYMGYAFSEAAFADGGKSLHLAVYGPELAGFLLERLPALAVLCTESPP
jgi:hypothetical protein